MPRALPLGILLATSEGVVQVLPGEAPRTVLRQPGVTALDASDGRVLAVAGQAVWLNDARGWRQVWAGEAECARIARDGTLCVAAGRSELWLSADDGEQWTVAPSLESVVRYERNRGRTDAAGWRLAAIGFPGNGLFVAIEGAGAWFSADRGRTWMPRAQDLDSHVYRLWEHAERGDRLYATTDSGLYRSDDDGFSWIQALGGITRSLASDLAVLPGAPDVVVLSAARGSRSEDGALYRSANGGVTWSPLALGGVYEWDTPPALARLEDSPDTVFAVAGGRAWGSHDRGETWLAVAEDVPPARAIVASF